MLRELEAAPPEVGFLGHNDYCEFRNIRLKELPDERKIGNPLPELLRGNGEVQFALDPQPVLDIIESDVRGVVNLYRSAPPVNEFQVGHNDR